MKKIIISIYPEQVVKILNGSKVFEIKNKLFKNNLPCEVYIYCTKKSNCEFPYLYKNTHYSRNSILKFFNTKYLLANFNKTELSSRQILNGKVVAKFTLSYLTDFKHLTKDNKNYMYTGKILKLQIFKKPVTLESLGITTAPKSWCYLNEGL